MARPLRIDLARRALSVERLEMAERARSE